MEELVLKRETNITSAEALDEIASAYPNAEILSFRRVKQAGENSEYYIARLRMVSAAEETDAEESHDDKLDEVLRLVRLLLKDEKEEEKEPEAEIEATEETSEPAEPMRDSHERAPLPAPQKAPIPNAGGGHISPIARRIVVERPADVSKKMARLELIREFSTDYKIEELNKIGSVYRASLIRIAEDEDVLEGQATNFLEQQKMQEEMARANAEYMREREQAKRRAPRREVIEQAAKTKGLHSQARRWLELMDEAGAKDEDIQRVLQFLTKKTQQEQKEFVAAAFKEWKNNKNTWEEAAGRGGVDTYEVDPRIRNYVQNIVDDLAVLTASDQVGADPSYYFDTLRNVTTFIRTIGQVAPEDQMQYAKQFFHTEAPTQKTYREHREELRRALKQIPQKQVAPPQEQPQLFEQQEGETPAPKSPYSEGTYIDYMWKNFGPQGRTPMRPENWEKELAEYNADPDAFEQGWSGQVNNGAIK